MIYWCSIQRGHFDMAVISELIDAGLKLKQQGSHQAAIEHFRQLRDTYPGHARIMFELADSWRVFDVPEQALALYRQLMALPKGHGLAPRDVPRLYAQMAATLLVLERSAESLAVIDEGLRLHPAYRPLRAYRMFALHQAGLHQAAMVESLELMVESLAPSKWDAFEEDIVQVVKAMRGRLEEGAVDEHEAGEEADAPAADGKDEELEEELEIEVKVRQPPPKPRKRGRKGQFGRKPVQIDISGDEDPAADDDGPAAAGKISIPIDLD